MNLIHDVFRPFVYALICVYLENILVYGETSEDHLKHRGQALDELREHKLYAKQSKSQISRATVDYLANIISETGFSMEDHKVQAIQS